MRLVPISVCSPGMRLGKPIFDVEGRVLLGANVELSGALIKRLGEHGIDYVYIQDPRTDDIVPEDMLSDETRIRATRMIRQHFSRMMSDSVARKATGTGGFSSTFRQLTDMIIEDLRGNQRGMIMLGHMQIMDHYLYQHSLNVCIYSALLGMKYGYSREELSVFTLGALLHDIGKTKLPAETLLKRGSLSEAELAETKLHSEWGFRIMREEPNIPLLSAHCALQHHERLDGSGYPRGLKGDEIHDYARWIGLVDSYDAMTTHRAYRSAMLPHEALEIIFTGSGVLYDKHKIELFRDSVAIYPIGVTVTLNSGETGIVVDLNAALPSRPIVRILQDPDGRTVADPVEIDLSKKFSVMVTGVNTVLAGQAG